MEEGKAWWWKDSVRDMVEGVEGEGSSLDQVWVVAGAPRVRMKRGEEWSGAMWRMSEMRAGEQRLKQRVGGEGSGPQRAALVK